jgi:hypothetical protein
MNNSVLVCAFQASFQISASHASLSASMWESKEILMGSNHPRPKKASKYRSCLLHIHEELDKRGRTDGKFLHRASTFLSTKALPGCDGGPSTTAIIEAISKLLMPLDVSHRLPDQIT